MFIKRVIVVKFKNLKPFLTLNKHNLKILNQKRLNEEKTTILYLKDAIGRTSSKSNWRY